MRYTVRLKRRWKQRQDLGWLRKDALRRTAKLCSAQFRTKDRFIFNRRFARMGAYGIGQLLEWKGPFSDQHPSAFIRGYVECGIVSRDANISKRWPPLQLIQPPFR